MTSTVCDGDTVRVGSRVRVLFSDGEDEYTIVGGEEADAASRRISTESPLAVALLGHTAGDQVDAGVGAAVHVGHVVLDDLPLPVAAEGLAGIGVDLDHGLMGETGLFQAQRLTARARADLQGSESTRQRDFQRPTTGHPGLTHAALPCCRPVLP